MRVLLVGLGGFLGSVARYGLASWVNRHWAASFPAAGTLAVNVVGCYGIGFLMRYGEARQLLGGDLWLFVAVGILGGFTTFSAFGNETWELARAHRPGMAALNVLANVTLGLAAVWLGRLSYAPDAT